MTNSAGYVVAERVAIELRRGNTCSSRRVTMKEREWRIHR